MGARFRGSVVLRSIILTSAVLAAAPAFAFTNYGLALYVDSAVADGDIFIDVSRRADMAQGIETYWQEVSARLPRLSPSEQDWLAAELDTTDTVRLARVAETEEFHLGRLAEIVDHCLEAAGKLTGALADEARSEFEMIHWVDVASCYQASEASLFRHLEGAGLDLKRDREDGYVLDASVLSKLLTVAIPSAMADQMGWTLGGG